MPGRHQRPRRLCTCHELPMTRNGTKKTGETIWRCSVKNRERQQRHFAKNREAVLERQRQNARKRYRRKRDFVRAYKRLRGCERCGKSPKDVTGLHLHHADPSLKLAPVASLYSAPRDVMLTEMLKSLVVLCEACHKEIHAEMREQKRRRKRR